MDLEQPTYSTTTIREIIRNWTELDPMSDEVIDIKTAAMQLDVVDKNVFNWVAEGLTFTQIGERVMTYHRDSVGNPQFRGRSAVSRLVRNIQYNLDHPWPYRKSK